MGEVASTARSGGEANRRQSKGGSHRRAEGMLMREEREQEKEIPGREEANLEIPPRKIEMR